MQEIWKAILNLKSAVDAHQGLLQFCWMNCQNGQILLNENPRNIKRNALIICDKSQLSSLPEATTFVLSKKMNVTPINQIGMAVEEVLFFKKYLPYCFLSIKAKKLNRTVSVTHFAQTLDAKIATNTGDSKWIGNQENLIHAHRMRALCNGVLVGSKTVESDNPRLNVRHVDGKNPTKIILGNPKSNFKSLLESSDAPILVLGKKRGDYPKAVQFIPIKPPNKTGLIPPKILLKKLFELGIYTIYIEGGATTTSTFINSKAVDILQLHIAPLLFGSGKASIELPTIKAVKEAIKFEEYHFLPFGDSVMFTGFLEDEV